MTTCHEVQARHERLQGLRDTLLESCEETCWEVGLQDRGIDQTPQPLPLAPFGIDSREPIQPPLESPAGDIQRRSEFSDRRFRRALLKKGTGCDDRRHQVDPASHEQAGGRQSPATAPVPGAAQTLAPTIFLRELARSAPRLPAVASEVQRGAAERAASFTAIQGKLEIELKKGSEQGDRGQESE